MYVFEIHNGREGGPTDMLKISWRWIICSSPRDVFCPGMRDRILTDSKVQGAEIGFSFIHSCTNPTELCRQ